MSVTVLCMRRFQVKANGVASMERLSKAVELPVMPPYGAVLDFNGGSRTAAGGESTFRNGGASGLALVDHVV